MADYSRLSRAQLSYEYLHTNSTTHEFLFGAMAELIDNARDANATRINIFSESNTDFRGDFLLNFLDDGDGMDPEEMLDVITFGKSTKRNQYDARKIGMYGNGLKSGSMRLGNDMIIFSKRGDTMSCLFLSRTFHEEELINEVIVPLPSFDRKTRAPLETDSGLDKHEMEMELIYKYSPFATESEFFAQFDRINSSSGTLVVIYNMKLLDCGVPELDVVSDPDDILLMNTKLGGSSTTEGMMPERKSFRAYTSILYMEPRMRVYIQGRKVRTKKLACGLYKPRMYKYSSYRFKTRSENEARKSRDEAKWAEERAREAVSKAGNLENKFGNSKTKEHRMEIRKAQTYATQCKQEALLRKQMAERKNKALKEPKTLSLIFGVNITNRERHGTFVYNCSRLIRMYEKVGPQMDGGVFCSGVVGIVDVPYLVLEPTHNKQDFADAKEYRHLLKIMGDSMEQYWKDVGIVDTENWSCPDPLACVIASYCFNVLYRTQQGVTKFWENFGYISGNWKDPPSQDTKYIRKRAIQLQTTLQCDKCLKWRTIPFNSNIVDQEFPDEWICELNNDASQNRCGAPEQKLNITEGTLKKEVKSQEDQERKIEEDIKKKQQQLSKLQKNKPMSPHRPFINDKRGDNSIRLKQPTVTISKKDRVPSPESRSPSPEVSKRTTKRKPVGHVQRIESSESRSPSPEVRRGPSRKVPLPQPKANNKATLSKSGKPPPSKPSAKSQPPPKSKDNFKPAPQRSSKPIPKAAPKAPPAPTKPTPKPTPPPATKSTPEVITQSQKSASASPVVAISDSNEEEQLPDLKSVSSSSANKLAEPDGTTRRSRSQVAATSGEENKLKRNSVALGDDSASPKKVKFETPVNISEDDNSKVAMDIDVGAVAQSPGSTSDPDSDAGVKVRAKVGDKWFRGVIVKCNLKENKVKVKFDKNPKDKCDKWYSKDSSDLKKLTEDTEDDENDEEVSQNEAPTSSTGATPSNSQYLEDISNSYRVCLRYFLPPQWTMDKEAVSALNIAELAGFPLDDFFDHYEKGLRKLVTNFQSEAAASRLKLSQLRKNIARLLRSINDEFDIDPEADGEQVDELLAACVAQTMQG